MKEQNPLATSSAADFTYLNKCANQPAFYLDVSNPHICPQPSLRACELGTMFYQPVVETCHSADLELAGDLDSGRTASQEVQHKQDQADNQRHVNESGGYVKCEKPKQPENNENCSDYPKHLFISMFLCAKTRAVIFPPAVVMLIRARGNNLQAGL
jgi:hypothetical protein